MCLAVMMNWSQAEIQIKRLNKGVKLTLGTVPGAEEGREREGEWCGTGAYAANGGLIILELDDGAVGHGGRSGVRPGLWMVLRC